ncbi:MAG: ferrous iron transport protein A [Actinobacteria bacterium]|nr:ferrous iron transport protein A [Actinomycetota bacterium]MBM3712601.1 ferrous iron transport protein A [Actinomycetota bacterium]
MKNIKNQNKNPGKDSNKILLACALPGRKYRIVTIYGGYGLNSRLHAMGIIPNGTVTVIYQTWGGPMTLAVKGVRIALGRGMAQKIEVSEVSE